MLVFANTSAEVMGLNSTPWTQCIQTPWDMKWRRVVLSVSCFSNWKTLDILECTGCVLDCQLCDNFILKWQSPTLENTTLRNIPFVSFICTIQWSFKLYHYSSMTYHKSQISCHIVIKKKVSDYLCTSSACLQYLNCSTSCSWQLLLLRLYLTCYLPLYPLA